MSSQYNDLKNIKKTAVRFEPRILSLDYETSPAKGYFFGNIYETNIIEIIEYEQILCVAWKWSDEKKVHVIGQDDFKGYKKGVLNDKELVEFFAPLIEEADMVSAHNGDRFDIPVFNTRLLAHGLKPIAPTKSIDTKKIAKNKFHLPSNKLDYIADFLGIPRKLSTHKSLWFGCEKGIESDWRYMKKYCKNDVLVQELVMKRILPFSKQNHNFNVITGMERNCPNPLCGSTRLHKRGFENTATTRFQRYQCQDCGTWSRSPLKEGSLIR